MRTDTGTGVPLTGCATVACAPVTLAALSPQAALPSPSTAVWQLGPVPIRAYALCIVAGHRGRLRGDRVPAAPPRRRPGRGARHRGLGGAAGIIGARIYHVITSPQAYFGEGGHPLKAFKIWEGGLGIWGAVAGGALGAWFAARQLGLPLTVVADALAPGLPLAQAVGRFGNWFNNELYGGPTTPALGPARSTRWTRTTPATRCATTTATRSSSPGSTSPTFLYEAIWDVGVAALVYRSTGGSSWAAAGPSRST